MTALSSLERVSCSPGSDTACRCRRPGPVVSLTGGTTRTPSHQLEKPSGIPTGAGGKLCPRNHPLLILSEGAEVGPAGWWEAWLVLLSGVNHPEGAPGPGGEV